MEKAIEKEANTKYRVTTINISTVNSGCSRDNKNFAFSNKALKEEVGVWVNRLIEGCIKKRSVATKNSKYT